MILVTFISIHFVIICDVLFWHTYKTYPALSLKSGCDTGLGLAHRSAVAARTPPISGSHLCGHRQQLTSVVRPLPVHLRARRHSPALCTDKTSMVLSLAATPPPRLSLVAWARLSGSSVVALSPPCVGVTTLALWRLADASPIGD